MIGGLLVDLLVLGAVAAFAWGATQLGGLSAIGRLVESVAAFAAAALMRDPAGSVVESIIGASEDFSRLVGMLVVALVAWIAVHSLFRTWRATRGGAPGDDELDAYAEPEADPLDSTRVAQVAGGLLGLGWALLFVALLVLQPASTPWSRGAIDSRVGGMLIHSEGFLHWLNDGFPHYTQALPKGKLGAVVGERDDLPMRDPVEISERGQDADRLLRSINGLRRDARVRVLTFNPDIAAIARRHAVALAQEQALSYRSPGGGPLDDRVQAALGESAGSFGAEVGVEVVWAHDPATAYRGVLDSSRAQSLVRDEQWTEIGLGVANAGWFNGRIYVLLLVGPAAGDVGGDGEVGDPEVEGADDADTG